MFSVKHCNNIINYFIFDSRPSKYVKVSGGSKVPYDHLILCTGEQYQISAPTGANINKLVTKSQLPNNPDRRYTGRVVPKNAFTINDEYDAEILTNWLQENFVNSAGECDMILFCQLCAVMSEGVVWSAQNWYAQNYTLCLCLSKMWTVINCNLICAY